jgi:hypothetical protein
VGDEESGGQGERETRGAGDKRKERRGDRARGEGRGGEAETRGAGDKGMAFREGCRELVDMGWFYLLDVLGIYYTLCGYRGGSLHIVRDKE